MWYSKTKGKMSEMEMFNYIEKSIKENRGTEIIVGTDSQIRKSKTCYISVIIVNIKGRGAHFYYRFRYNPKRLYLHQKIWIETSETLDLANKISERMNSLKDQFHMELHADVGHNGRSKELISAIVGLFISNNYCYKVKPDAYAATKVADKIVKSGALTAFIRKKQKEDIPERIISVL